MFLYCSREVRGKRLLGEVKMESARRLTDEELLNREFTTLDPASLPGLSAEAATR